MIFFNRSVFIFLLFLLSCESLEFTYKNDIRTNNKLYNSSSISQTGKEIQAVKSYFSKYFGYNELELYNLNVDITEKQLKRSVQSNQAITKLDYELVFDYSVFSKPKDCVVYNRSILSRFSYTPKSSGYNYGSDKSLDRLYELTAKNSFEQFSNFIIDETFQKCLNEN